MNFQQDWVLRQIENLAHFIARLLFGVDEVTYEVADETNLTPTDETFLQLMELLALRDLCAAENLLYENYEPGNLKYLALAVDFYQRLNAMSSGELAACNFSRAEVHDGFREFATRYGVPEL